MVKTVSLPKPAPDLLLLHIELKWITPTIWRRFVVPESITLGKLHHVIQVVMGWSDSHLHEFEIAGEKYGFCSGLQRRRRSWPSSSPLCRSHKHNRLPIPYRREKRCPVFQGARSQVW
jgi:hypothetical protein